jgi:hypothetical protein
MSTTPPVLVNPYCTVADVQLECQNDRADDVRKIILAINAASRWIDGYCRRDFLFHDHASTGLQVQRSWGAENKLFLPWPVITLTEATLDGTVLPAEEYAYENPYLASGSTLTRAGAAWFLGDRFTADGLIPQKLRPLARVILLKGTFGYRMGQSGDPADDDAKVPSPDLPAEIVYACTVLAAVRSGLSRKQIVDQGGTVQSMTAKNVPKEIMDSLQRFRMRVI